MPWRPRRRGGHENGYSRVFRRASRGMTVRPGRATSRQIRTVVGLRRRVAKDLPLVVVTARLARDNRCDGQ